MRCLWLVYRFRLGVDGPLKTNSGGGYVCVATVVQWVAGVFNVGNLNLGQEDGGHVSQGVYSHTGQSSVSNSNARCATSVSYRPNPHNGPPQIMSVVNEKLT